MQEYATPIKPRLPPPRPQRQEMRPKYFEEEEENSSFESGVSNGTQRIHRAQVIGRPLPVYPEYSRKVSATASIHSIKAPAPHNKKASMV